MNTLATLLRDLGLEHYLPVFEREEIRLEDLRLLAESDLASLGLPLGPRRRLIAALAGRTEQPHASQTPPATDPRPRGERRQLTVLFCDLVGSTELSVRMDPEELRRTIRQYQDTCVAAVTRFGGHVAQFLGDGVLVYFGYPKAMEDGAGSAVRAALAIRDSLSVRSGETGVAGSIQVRLGIDTGVVVIGEALSTHEADRTATGDAPNIAARLQQLASPGTVVASHRTKALAEGAFHWTSLGAQAIKGLADPIVAWRADAERAVETRFDARPGGAVLPMVGRSGELDKAMAAWASTASGQGRVLLVRGEAGVGKSRLLRALREHLGGRGAIVWQFQCSPFFTSTALHALSSSIERRMRFQREESTAARLERVVALLCGEYGRPRQEALMIARLLEVPVDDQSDIQGLTPQRLKEITIEALVNWAVAESTRGPLLFLLEDAHWSDPTTIEAITALARQVPTHPILLVVAFRPGFDASPLGSAAVEEIALENLDAADTARLATEVAEGRRLPDEIVRLIVEKTDGVPLFVEELTKALLESSLLVAGEGEYRLAGSLAPMAVPNSLRDSLMARLDRLAPTKEVAQVGACIGREFSAEQLAIATDLPPSRLDEALARLVEAQLLYRRMDDGAATFVFKHALVQEAAYESLLKSRRAEIHRRIAEGFLRRFPERSVAQPEVLAHHFTRAGMHAEAIPHWIAAGTLALQRMAPREAINHLEQALALIGGLPAGRGRDEAELNTRILLGSASMALGGWFHPGIESAMRPALPIAESLGRSDAAMLILWGLGIQALTTGRVGESLPWARRLAQVAERSDDDTVKLIADALMGLDLFWHGDLAESTRHLERVLRTYDRSRHNHVTLLTNHDPRVVAELYGVHRLWMTGFPDQSVAAAENLDHLATEYGHPFDLGFALTLGQWAYLYRREPEPLLAKIARCVEMATAQGLPFFSVVEPAFLRGFPLLHAGRIEESIAQFEQGLAIRASLGGFIARGWVLMGYAEALLAAGRVRDARTAIDGALEQVGRPGWEERIHLAEILRVDGEIALAEGDGSRAEGCYRRSIEFAQVQGSTSWALRTAVSLGALLGHDGRHSEALSILEPLYESFTEGFESHDLRAARKMLERLARA